MASPEQLLQVIHLQTDIAKLGLDLGNVMNLVVERTTVLIDADGVAIELAEDNDMVYRAVAGSARSALGLRIAKHGSLSGLCVRTGETLRCDDAENDPRVDREACRRVGLRSMSVLPLTHRGATVGILKAMSAQPNAFSERDAGLVGLLSEVGGAAMFYATKYETDDLFYQATHDSLTGLANRALFMDRLRNTLTRNERGRLPLDVLMIDMDGLKPVNDPRGHRVMRCCASSPTGCGAARAARTRWPGWEATSLRCCCHPAWALPARRPPSRVSMRRWMPHLTSSGNAYRCVPAWGSHTHPRMEATPTPCWSAPTSACTKASSGGVSKRRNPQPASELSTTA